MTASADIFAVRTGRATVLIGPPAALGEAHGEALMGREREAALHLEMALDACRDVDGIRQYCVRWGLDTNNLSHIGHVELRAWLLNAVRDGRLGVALLQDVLFTAGAVQALAGVTRTRIALRIERLGSPPDGRVRQPLQLIEAMQAARPSAQPSAAGEPTAPRRGDDLTLSDIRAMALEDRILEVLRQVLAAPDRPTAAKEQAMQPLVNRHRLADTVAELTALAGSHEGKLESLASLAVNAFGANGLDGKTMAGVKSLSEALIGTREAQDAADLSYAAKRLAHAIDLLSAANLHRLMACSASLPNAVPLKTGGLKTRNKGISTPKPEEKIVARPAPKDEPPKTAPADETEKAQSTPPTKSIPGRGKHVETIDPHPVKPEDMAQKQKEFLGDGPYTNIHPRTGLPDPDRVVSADGKRSIRYGNHEKNSSPNRHHYHEETWTYDPDTHTMSVDNKVIRVPLPKPKKSS